MTLRKRISIEPHDIESIACECSKCRYRYSIPIENFAIAAVVCSNCHEPLTRGEATIESAGEPRDVRIMQFVRALQAIKGVALSGKIYLEISSSAFTDLEKL